MAVKTAPPPRHVQGHFLNRELGLLEFNRRVLAQARGRRACRCSSGCASSASSRPTSTSSSRSASPACKEQIKLNVPGRRARTARRPREVFQAISRIAHDLVARPVPAAERRDPAGRSSARASSSCAASDWTAAQRAWVARLLPPRDDAGADADRARPGAPVPARLQQEPQLRRRARGTRRLRPRRRASRSCRRRASCRASSSCRPSSSDGRRTRFVFLSSILHEHVAGAVRRHEGARLLPVPRHAQQRPVRRRGGGEGPAHARCRASCRSATSATPCASRSPTTARRR